MKPIAAANLLLLLLLIVLPGCKTVYSDHLIGEPVEAEAAELLEGIWRFGDSAMHVKHIEGGEYVAAVLEWNDGEFKISTMDIVITQLGEVHFLHATEAVESEEDDEGHEEHDNDNEPWIIAGVLTGTQEDALVLSAPEFDRLAEAIEAGRLEGEIDEDNNSLHIQGEKETLDDVIESEPIHELFDLLEPMVIKRLGDME